VLEHDSPTVEELAEGIESSTTTVYEDVKHLVDIGLPERVTETQPHRYRASRVDMTIQAGGETFQITPTLLVALAERQSNENISLYIDRHGVSGLATAIEYARAYTQSEMNARIMAREQDIPVLEAETILQELQEIILRPNPIPLRASISRSLMLPSMNVWTSSNRVSATISVCREPYHRREPLHPVRAPRHRRPA